MQIPVSELIVRYMERLGIEAIFGSPGAHILPVYDAREVPEEALEAAGVLATRCHTVILPRAGRAGTA